MDRKRHLAALAGLHTVQRLQVSAALVDLAGALDGLAAAEDATEASREILGACEIGFDEILATASLDPDAMRRAGFAILLAEEKLTENIEMGRHAELAEIAARTEWHGHRLRSQAIGEQRRQLYRKLVQTSEDKAALEVMALAASRRAVS